MKQAIYIGTFLFIAGMLTGDRFNGNISSSLLLAITVLLLTVFAAVKTLRKYVAVILSIILLMCGLLSSAQMGPGAAEFLKPYYSSHITAYGRIDPASVKQTEYGTSFILNCSSIEAAEKQIAYDESIRVFTKSKITGSGVVSCSGYLQELSNFHNPGTFDMYLWNRIHGLGGFLKQADVHYKDEQRNFSDSLVRYSLHLKNEVSSLQSGDTGKLLGNMVFGGSSNLSEETRKVFADNGIIHLLSVSGSNMVLLTSFLLIVLGNFRFKALIIAIFLTVYAGLCGFQPPVWRALLMSLVLLYEGKNLEKGILLCLVAIVTLIFKPLWVYDVGFQLSFGATAGLIWLLPKLKIMLSAYLPLWLSEAAAVTMAAQLAILPLLINYFHQLSVISVISNIILVPILELATILTLLGMMLWEITGMGAVLIKLAGFFTKQVIVQGQILSLLPGSVLVIRTVPLWCCLLYYFLLAISFDFTCLQFLQNKERKAFIVALSLILGGYFAWQKLGTQQFTAYFLDVGQGDCAVIVTEQQKVAVIDTGGLKGYDVGSRIIAPFLYSMGKDEIDVLLLSHGDYDHAGGAESLADYVDVKQVLLPPGEEMAAWISERFANRCRTVQAGEIYQLDENALLKILSASQHAAGNDGSVVCEITYDKQNILFTGDISAEVESCLVNLHPYTVLKAAHHGSKYSSSEEFLLQVRPQLTVISAGKNNSYGHPHQETLDRLEKIGSKIMRTDQMGAVKVVFDDEGTKCYSYLYQRKYF